MKEYHTQTIQEKAKREWRKKENICIAISVTCSVMAAIISAINILMQIL